MFSTAKMKVCQWACARARNLKAQMKERSVTRKNMMMKRTVYARLAARAGGQVKKEEGHGIVSTSKYCAKGIEDDEDDDEANEEEEDRVGTTAQGGDNDLDAFEALFKPLSSSPTLRFVASQHSRSPFPPSLSLLSPISTPGLSTPDLLVPDPWLELEPGYAHHVLPSPMISCASVGSDTSSAPATPTTSKGSSFPFPGVCMVDETEVVPVKPRLHLRPNPRPRAQFRTLSASITARSPLSLSFPLSLSLSLPLSTRRSSSPGTAVNRYMEEQGKQDDGRVVKRGRAGRDVVGAGVTGKAEDGDGVGDGEDPFGTHARAYYTPRARAALGFGDAYDLSAWEWACDYSPCRRAKMQEEKLHVQAEQQQWGVHSGPATTAATGTTTPAFAFVDANFGNTLVGGTGPGSWSVYHTPIHAASDPQLSCARRPDEDLEYLRAMATTRGRFERPPAPVRPGPSTRDRRDQQHTPGYRSGIRPLLLPQKLGLPGSGMSVQTRTNNTHLSGGRGRGPTGWERDLECGVSGEEDVANA
jgi:hypothetical protein